MLTQNVRMQQIFVHRLGASFVLFCRLSMNDHVQQFVYGGAYKHKSISMGLVAVSPMAHSRNY